MSNYRYLILGGGMTVYATIRKIRELDSEGSIALVAYPAISSYWKECKFR